MDGEKTQVGLSYDKFYGNANSATPLISVCPATQAVTSTAVSSSTSSPSLTNLLHDPCSQIAGNQARQEPTNDPSLNVYSIFRVPKTEWMWLCPFPWWVCVKFLQFSVKNSSAIFSNYFIVVAFQTCWQFLMKKISPAIGEENKAPSDGEVTRRTRSEGRQKRRKKSSLQRYHKATTLYVYFYALHVLYETFLKRARAKIFCDSINTAIKTASYCIN